MNELLSEIWAVAMRNRKTEKKWRRFIYGLIGISIMFLAVGQGLQLIVSDKISNYSGFFTLGMLAYFIIVTGLNIGFELVLDDKNQIKLLLVAPISKHALLLGNVLGGLIGSMMLYGPMVILFMIIGGSLSLAAVLSVPLIFILFLIMGVSLSIAVASLIQDKSLLRNVFSYGNSILVMISGTFFPTSSLPGFAQYIARLNPIVYFLDFARYFLQGSSEYPIVFDSIVVIAFTAVTFVLAIKGFDRRFRN